MSLTSLLEPLYNLRQDFTRGMQKVESIKMPSLADVKGFVSNNRYILAATAAALTGIGMGVFTDRFEYFIGGVGLSTIFFLTDKLKDKNTMYGMLIGDYKKTVELLGKSVEIKEKLLDYTDLLEREIAGLKGKPVA